MDVWVGRRRRGLDSGFDVDRLLAWYESIRAGVGYRVGPLQRFMGILRLAIQFAGLLV